MKTIFLGIIFAVCFWLFILFLTVTHGTQYRSKYDVVRDCQQIASRATQAGWKYEYCLNDLYKQLDQKQGIGI